MKSKPASLTATLSKLTPTLMSDTDEDENEILDCPRCNRAYDDADADFLICHHCGHNANKGGDHTDRRKVNRSLTGYGIDPDVKLDDWEP